MKLKEAEWRILCEALRRFECFGHRRDHRDWTIENLMLSWTGLGVPSHYRPAVDAGLMTPMKGREIPRANNWYTLTEKGAKIVLEWHLAGHTCGDGYELTTFPPAYASSV